MSVDQVDTRYYSAVQSTADYSARDSAARASSSSSAPENSVESRRTDSAGQAQPPRDEQRVSFYFYDPAIGQNVNLLV